jgi:hypothetical protein
LKESDNFYQPKAVGNRWRYFASENISRQGISHLHTGESRYPLSQSPMETSRLSKLADLYFLFAGRQMDSRFRGKDNQGETASSFA